jgi:flagellar hook assembly protein FlgD
MSTNRFSLTFASIVLALLFPFILEAQNTDNQSGITPGTLTFTVKTVTNNSTYSPKNVLAIWIKDAQGTFVVSKKVMANTRKQHLVKWNASSAGNTASATTGATLSSHQTHTVTWDGKNAAGTNMPDGIYQIWVEYTSTNSASNGNQGPFLTVEFDKGPAIAHIAPANATYYQNIVADWVPTGVGLNDLSRAGASAKLYPNPFSNQTTLQLVCDKPSQAYISVFDASGKKVAVLLNDSFGSGTHTYKWDGTSDNGKKLNNGIYFVEIQVNGFTEIQKMVINR